MSRAKRILIIGDTCLDRFVYCHAHRLAPDLPVPVLKIIEETENPGMAKNVERNIKAIYRHCDIITNSNWRKMTKTRYVHQDSNHTFIRIDNEPSLEHASVRRIPYKSYDIIGISDYDKGFLSEEDIAYICAHHDNVFMDTKKILGPWAKGARFIKINNIEYARSKHAITPALAKKIIHTKGSHGAEYRGKTYPIAKVDVKDLTGAGDSFFAALLVRYAETEDIEESIRFANECAREVVQHRGVTVIHRPHHK
jgi:bifunctional ADP-heptose synthase (sugar kinase/adenylyltransferase)